MTDHAETLDTLKTAARAMRLLPGNTPIRLVVGENGDVPYYTLALDTLRAACRLAAPPPQDSKVGPWRIWYDPPPIGTRNCDWHYQHEDCDGPESPAWMTGHCASREACIIEIVETMDDLLAQAAHKAEERARGLRAAIQHARFQIGDGQESCVFYNLGTALKEDDARSAGGDPVRSALDAYHQSLLNREHGDVAADKLVKAIEAAYGRTFDQFASVKRQEEAAKDVGLPVTDDAEEDRLRAEDDILMPGGFP